MLEWYNLLCNQSFNFQNNYIWKGEVYLKRGKTLYVGKTNTVYEVLNNRGKLNPNVIELECTDRISMGDGEKTDVIKGKAYANNVVSTLLFERFNKMGIATHYIGPGTTPTSKFVKKAEMIPLEVIGRNFSAGSFCRRYGVKEGLRFDPLLIEFNLKNDRLHDPLILPQAIEALGIATDFEIIEICDFMEMINAVSSDFFKELELTLVDFKVEFGYDLRTGKMILADEFSQDTCRLHDKYGNSVDKDLFRRGASNEEVSNVYKKLLTMMKKGE